MSIVTRDGDQRALGAKRAASGSLAGTGWHKNKRRRKSDPIAYLYILPMILLIVVFQYIPFVRTLLQAFHRVSTSGELLEYVGLENFRNLFANRNFIIALRNTARFTLVYVPTNLLSALLLAKFATPDQPVSRVATGLLTLPMMISLAAISLIAKLLLNPVTGLVNYVFGLDWGWFTDRNQALWSILLVTYWLGLPFSFLVFRSAFLNVPSSLTEAAKIDAANGFQRFLYIELPLISPQILTIFCLNMIQALLMAGPVLILTDGGPRRSTMTLIFLMYSSGYQSSNYALSATVSLFSLVLTLAFTLLLFFTGQRKAHYQ